MNRNKLLPEQIVIAQKDIKKLLFRQNIINLDRDHQNYTC